jgi:GNAT superfamily N-acetyltransferase
MGASHGVQGTGRGNDRNVQGSCDNPPVSPRTLNPEPERWSLHADLLEFSSETTHASPEFPLPHTQAQLDSVPAPTRAGERIIARLGSTEILLVTSDSAEAERALAEQVARRAMRDTPFDTPAYTRTDNQDIRVLIAREAGAAVGLAVLRPRPRWGWWSWDDYDAERRPATGVAPMTSWTVETIWTHPSCQARGLARRLVELASEQVDRPVTSFGWRRPFTPSGEAFVRHLCPEGFWMPD